jgi:hypothetical protein
MKSVVYWWKDRHTNQWKKTENPEIDAHKYSQLNFDKSAKAISWRKARLVNSVISIEHP